MSSPNVEASKAPVAGNGDSTAPPPPAVERLPAAWWAILTAYALALFLPGLGDARTLTDHETYQAAPARGMIESGDWLAPRIGELDFPEKPPLPYWLSAAAMTISGRFDEASVRLPSVLAGLGVVLVVAGLTCRWFGPAAGLAAGLIQASTVYTLTYARLAESDVVCQFLVVASLAAFVRLQTAQDRAAIIRGRLLFWGLVGLTNLAKGLLFGAALVLATCLVHLLRGRDWSGLRRLASPTGVVLAIALGGWWPALAVQRNPDVLNLWSEHLFARATGGGTLAGGEPPWHYLTTWWWQMLPWTPLVPVGAGATLGRAWADARSAPAFVWTWALVQTALLSAASGKHHHYLIHALPALSPIAAVGLLRLGGRFEPDDPALAARRRAFWSRALLFFWTPAAIIAAVICAAALADYAVECWLIGGAAAVGFCAAGLCIAARRATAAWGVCLAAVAVVSGVAHLRLVPRLDRSADDVALIRRAAEHVGPDGAVFSFGNFEAARVVFYFPRPIRGIVDLDELRRTGDSAGSYFVLARSGRAEQLGKLGAARVVMQSRREYASPRGPERLTLYRFGGPARPEAGE